MDSSLTRRGFGTLIGAALGGALLSSRSAAATGTGPAGGPAASVPIRLDSNENPYGPSSGAMAAMDRARPEAARYPDVLEDRLVETLAKHHGVDSENVVLGCGSGEILRMADLAFAGPGKSVIAAEPTFEAVLSFARVLQSEAITVPLTADFRHDLPAMARACDARTGIVYVCNPNNPTGTIVTRDEMAEFLDAVPKSAVTLVDEAYHHFVEDSAYATAADRIGRTPNLVVVRTFSKIYGLAGMRLGYGLGPKDKIETMRRYKTWSNANAAVLEAALASLGDPGHVTSLRRTMNDTRRDLCAALQKEGRRVIPSQANFVMIEMGRDVGPVIEALHSREVHPGRRFAAMPSWLRVSIGTPKEMEGFLAALREVAPAKATRAA